MPHPPAPKHSSRNWIFSFSVAGIAVLGCAWWAGLLPDFSGSRETASERANQNDSDPGSEVTANGDLSGDKTPPLEGVTQWEPEIDAQLVSHSRIVDSNGPKQSPDEGANGSRPLSPDEQARISQLFADDQPYFADENSGLIERNVVTSDLGAIPSSNDVQELDHDRQFGNIDAMIATGKILEAHRELSLRYWNHPEQRAEVLPRVQKTARTIYLSPQPHFMQAYEVQPGDMLQQIAPVYQLSWEYLSTLNGVTPERIRAGQKLKVIKGPFEAFVDLSDFRLTIHAHGYFVKEYAIGIGKDNSTPLGTFKVRDKLKNPVYYPPEGGIVDADDPANPLGERWIGLGEGYGIHGTIDPESIGKAESKGCLRLSASDIAEVYDFLTISSEVAIRP